MNGDQYLALWVVMPVLGLAALLILIRLSRGPSLADRVISIDLLLLLGVGMTAAYSVVMEEPILLDVSILVALVAFVGTVAFARYLEKRID